MGTSTRRRIATGIGLAAVAALIARRPRSRPHAPGDLAPLSSTSRGGRATQLGRMGTRVAGATAVNRAKWLVADVDGRAALDEELQLRSAEEVAATLGQMKGALMKVGQIASFVDDGMPEHVRAALSQLQQDAPPMSAELAAGVVASELGGRPDQLFADWDPIPLAAASIGQVHRARTHDGIDVAVKVQYPGVDEAIAADLSGLDPLLGNAGLLYKGFDPGPMIEEIKDRIGEELDYTIEAANQQRFAEFYAGHPFIDIPAVVPELSARRVLTTTLADGARFDEMEHWDDAERQLAAEAIFRFVFRSLYRLGSFNGDPHPGNYLFRPGGKVTFLDFGLVSHFEPQHLDVLQDMARWAVLEPDRARFREAMERAGYFAPGAPVSDDAIWDYSLLFYEIIERDETVAITPEYASEVAHKFLFGRASHREAIKWANMPPHFVILQRINLGLNALLGRLNATANWRRISLELWPATNGPASTRMGELEAEWWRDVHATR